MSGDRIPLIRQDGVIQGAINALTESRRIHTEQQRIYAHRVEELDQQIDELRRLNEKWLIFIDCGRERIEQICHKCTRNYQQRRTQTGKHPYKLIRHNQHSDF